MTDAQIDALLADEPETVSASASRYFVGLGNAPDNAGRALHTPILAHVSCSHLFVDAHEAGQFLQLALSRSSLPQAISTVRTAGYVPATSVGVNNIGGFAHLLTPRDLWACVFYPAPHLETSRYRLLGRRRWQKPQPNTPHELPVLLVGQYADRDLKVGSTKTHEIQMPYVDGKKCAEHLFLAATLARSVG